MSIRSLNKWVLSATLMHTISATAVETLPLAYRVVAESASVPVDILYSVALVESGSSYEGLAVIPWPWALNIEGRSYYCDSKLEAIMKINQAVSNAKAVDIGLMQISWRWHSQRFNNIEQALIPIRNLQVGAIILREQFEISKDWWEAVGRYHDPGQDKASLRSAERYRQKVKTKWENHFQ